MDAHLPKSPRARKMYVLRIRQADGTWVFDMDSPMPKRDADFHAKRNRLWLGVLCQVWTETEAATILEQSK